MIAITLESVTRRYTERAAIQNLSLHIEAGERLVIFGPSGCGKTTLLRLLAGFIAPNSGIIRMHNRVVSHDGHIDIAPENRQIGMVFQDLALWDHLTVKGNLEFGLKVRKVPKPEREVRITNLLQRVGLVGMENRYPHTLSGGQQQRVALARALILNPPIVLMDEPLANLDVELNIRLRRFIRDLQQEFGFTLVYVTHNPDEAFEIATRVIMLRDGQLQFDGSVEAARQYFYQQILGENRNGE